MRALACLLLCACVTMGARFDPKDIDRLCVGQTTVADAVKLLGKPAHITYAEDGTRLLLWMFSTGTAWGTGKSESVTVLFSQTGRMVRLVNSGSSSVH
jgi:hypothetical protein